MAAGALVVLAGALFAAVYLMYDGSGVVSGLVETVQARFNSANAQPAAEPSTPTDELKLPEGMPDEFALHLWEEQVASQRAIRPLVEGDAKTLRISDAKIDGDQATVAGTLVLNDGSSIPGYFTFEKFGDDWYLAYATYFREGAEARETAKPAPGVGEVDIGLLNTIVVEQQKSKAVTKAMVEGTIREFKVGAVRNGPNTATVPLTIVGGPSEGEAELIVIRAKDSGEDFWFITRFAQIGSTQD